MNHVLRGVAISTTGEMARPEDPKTLPEVLEQHEIGRLRPAVDQNGVPVRRNGKTAHEERVAHAPDLPIPARRRIDQVDRALRTTPAWTVVDAGSSDRHTLSGDIALVSDAFSELTGWPAAERQQ